MRCLPFCSYKKVFEYTIEYRTHYEWYDKLSKKRQSFNDQPAYVYIDILYWYDKGNIHRSCNKPSHYVTSNRDLVFYTRGIIVRPPLNIHKDYQTSRM